KRRNRFERRPAIEGGTPPGGSDQKLVGIQRIELTGERRVSGRVCAFPDLEIARAREQAGTGDVMDRPAVELERVAPGVDELGQAVAIRVPYLTVSEVVAVEHAPVRTEALHQDRVHHFR